MTLINIQNIGVKMSYDYCETLYTRVRRIISDYYIYFEYINDRILMSEWRCVGHTKRDT